MVKFYFSPQFLTVNKKSTYREERIETKDKAAHFLKKEHNSTFDVNCITVSGQWKEESQKYGSSTIWAISKEDSGY